jgi:hypothetical protein
MYFSCWTPCLLRYTHLLKDMEREEAVIRGWEPNQVSHIQGPRFTIRGIDRLNVM